MSSEDSKTLEDMIRDKLADDDVICDLFEHDEDFEHMMELISDTIGEWSEFLFRLLLNWGNIMLDYIEAAVLVVVLLGLAGWFYLEKR